MQELEVWKPIVGYEGWYEVSSLGRVRSVSHTIVCNNRYEIFHKGKILRQQANVRWRYLSVYLSKNGERKRYVVHRLVAMAFLPNPNNLPEVNHKDENRQNNSVGNLEWCDRVYNTRYGTGDERRRATARNNKLGKCYPKRISQYTLDGRYIASYGSSEEAARAIGFPRNGGNIRTCARGEKGIKQSLGYIWKYTDEPDLFL